MKTKYCLKVLQRETECLYHDREREESDTIALES